MPTPMPRGLRLGAVEPRDAIAAFTRRGLLQPSYSWLDVWQHEHASAFAVAGVARLDILRLVQAELDKALAQGASPEAFARALRPALVAQGWWGDVEVADPQTGETRSTRFDNRRLRLIFDTNIRQSHAAGQWARIERSAAVLPYVLYRTMQDERVRASHRPWDGIVLPVGHAFWRTHFPPNGWGCRCRAFAVGEADIERRRARGETIKTQAPPIDYVPFVNARTGEITPVPRGIDPGFAYNPGQAREAALHTAALAKALQASPLAGAVAVAQAAQDQPAMLAQAGRALVAWLEDAGTRPAAGRALLGTLPPQAVRAGAALGVQVGAVLAVRGQDAARLRTPLAEEGAPQASPGAEPLTPDLAAQLPALLAAPRAVLIERGGKRPGNRLTLVVPHPQRPGHWLWLQVRRSALGAGPYALVALHSQPPQGLGSPGAYTVLHGSLPQP